MDASSAALVSAIIGGVNLLVLLGVAFTGGRWMGRVETRLDHLERSTKGET